MNIFVLDDDEKLCAQYHHDVHLRKMIVETAQLLSTAHHIFPSEFSELNKIYKKTHENHPCSLWVRKTMSNYRWSWALLFYMCHEYSHRFGKKHKTESLLPYLQSFPNILDSGQTPHPLCMPIQYKKDDVVESYRSFYKKEKMLDKNGNLMANWTNRETPHWL